MHFRKIIFLPFLAVALLIFLVSLINPPYLYGDRAYLHGLQLKSDVQTLRVELRNETGLEIGDSESLNEQFTSIDGRIDNIIDDGRERHYSYSRLVCQMVALGFLVLGLIITLVMSWRKDVQKLSKGVNQSPM